MKQYQFEWGMVNVQHCYGTAQAMIDLTDPKEWFIKLGRECFMKIAQ